MPTSGIGPGTLRVGKKSQFRVSGHPWDASRHPWDWLLECVTSPSGRPLDASHHRRNAQNDLWERPHRMCHRTPGMPHASPGMHPQNSCLARDGLCSMPGGPLIRMWGCNITARLAQSAERKALNLVVVGSSPTVGVFPRPLVLHTNGRFS